MKGFLKENWFMIFQSSKARLVYSTLKNHQIWRRNFFSTSKTQILGTHMLIGELPIWGVIIVWKMMPIYDMWHILAPKSGSPIFAQAKFAQRQICLKRSMCVKKSPKMSNFYGICHEIFAIISLLLSNF